MRRYTCAEFADVGPLSRDLSYSLGYPCCCWAHSSLDGVQHLMQENGLTHDDVVRVEIRTFHYAARLAGHEPKTLDEFSYSIAFPMAAMIVRGTIGPAELTPETLKDPDILRISRATVLIDDPEMTARSKEKRWAEVAMILRDGRRIQGESSTPRSDVDHPITDAEISAKFHLLADDVLGLARAAEMEDLCGRFDTLDGEGFGPLMGLCLHATV